MQLAGMAWFIKHRTDVPEITSIVADVPGLHPNFTPEVQDYSPLGGELVSPLSMSRRSL